jgi:hypothetical protein
MKSNTYQKMLDKQRLLWYNTRVRYSPKVTTEELVAGKISHNKELTKDLNTLLSAFGRILVQVQEKHLPKTRTPVIAGGAVRDMAFGLTPKDYDIFFDVSSVPKDEQEDLVLLVGSYFLEEAKKTDWFSHFDGTNLNRKSKQYIEGVNGFLVYESIQANFDIEDVSSYLKFQFIGHDDARLTEDPKTFLDAFDWPFTKTLYDPLNGFFFHNEFINLLKDRKLAVSSDGTYTRVSRWLERFRPYKYTAPFKLEDKRPKTGSGKYSTNHVTISNALLQQFNWEIVQRMERQIGNVADGPRFILDVEADGRI